MAGFKEYTMMFQLSAATSAQFSSAFSGAQAQITQLQSKIDALNKQQGDITAYQKQQTAVEKTKGKLELLKQQYENLRKAQEKAGGEDTDIANKMLAKEAQINKTSDALDSQTKKLDSMGNALNEAGVDTNNLAAESQRLEAELSGLRDEQEAVADAAQNSSQSFAEAASAMEQMLVASGVVDLLKSIGGALKECTDASIQYETAMAGVKRTVGGSDDFIEGLGDEFKYLSTVIPITSTELAGIATTAGQLGIAQDNVSQFTEVMAKLATTTDLTADDAATMLAQFANITGTTQYDRLGATVASLGDATATTASKVVQMSQGLAASASQAGMSETDILGISAAVGSLGIEAQAGSTAMSTLISTLYKAVETGDGLQDFASVAGMTADQFKSAWAEDAAGAMNSFIMGLNDVERNGKSAVVILDELGITNVRQTKAILGLASANGLLTSTIEQANQAWQDNTALDEKAAIMYETTESKIAMMNNAFANVKMAVGDSLTPAMGDLAGMATRVMQPISEFLAKNPAVVKAMTAAVGVIGAVTAGVVGLSAALKVASVVGGMFSASLGPVFAIAGGLALVTGIAIGLSDAFGNTAESYEQLSADFDDTVNQINQQQHILDLCDEYRQLQNELQGVTDVDNPDITFTATLIKNGFEGETDIAQIKELSSAIDNKEGEIKQILEVNGAKDITDEDLDKIVELSSAILTKKGELQETLSVLGVENISEEDLQKIRTLAREIKTDKGTLTQIAQLYGLDNIDEDDILKISDLSDAITDKRGALEQTLSVLGADKVSDSDINTIVNLASAVDTKDGDIKQQLELIGVEDVTTADILKIRQMAQSIKSGEGELSETLSLIGFDNYDNLMAACGLADEVAGANVSSTISITLDNVDETVAHLNEMAAELATAKEELTTAQADLASLQDEYRKTNNNLLATNEKDEKSAYAAQLEELSEAIATQKTRVGDLQGKYNTLNAEYEAGTAAVQEFYDKQAQAAAIAEELGISAESSASGIATQTAAINEQIDAVEALAKARQADLKKDLYANAAKQAKQYSDAIDRNNELQAEFATWSEKAANAAAYEKMSADEVNAAYQQLIREYDDMIAQPDFVPFNDEAIAKAREIQSLAALMGTYFEDLAQYADGQTSFDALSWVSTNDASLNAEFEHINAMVSEFGTAIGENQEIIDSFINSLVEGVQTGAISIEEAEGLVNRTFSSLSNGGELTEDVMQRVAAAMADSADGAEDLADGIDDASNSAVDFENAINPIIAKMDELSEAYAKAYENAKSSLDGQFDLFELVGEIKIGDRWVNASESSKEKSDQSMREALESQAKYFEEYNSLLQQAQQKGVNTDLLATLADASMESAETLKYIASDSVSEEDIASLNAAYAKVGDAKTELAGTMADIETDFTSTMADLQSEMQTTVEEMDMSAEAASAAQTTLQAMADKANDMLPTVQAAYKAIADAATAELAKIHAPAVSLPGVNVSGTAAEGTDSAHEGVYLVGEKGPELVYMHGGEQVFTAAETAAMLSNYGSPEAAQPLEAVPSYAAFANDAPAPQLVFSPVYNITGATNSEDLREVLREHDEEMREQFEQMLADVESDRERRAFV